MNYIWAVMMIAGVIFSMINGRLPEFSEGILSGCSDAIYFVIGIAGIMAVWSGLMNIAKTSGLIDIIASITSPLMKFLFPQGVRSETASMMLMSFTANLFGAGNSATVFSIKAMEMLDEENNFQSSASNSMCMFMGVSMSMIQLVPITVIKIRSDAGSTDPTGIIVPSIIAGAISLIASVILCKFYERKKSYE